MLRYRRGALGGTQERNYKMQHENLIVTTPPREAALASCARFRPRAPARATAEKKLGIRLFED